MRGDTLKSSTYTLDSKSTPEEQVKDACVKFAYRHHEQPTRMCVSNPRLMGTLSGTGNDRTFRFAGLELFTDRSLWLTDFRLEWRHPSHDEAEEAQETAAVVDEIWRRMGTALCDVIVSLQECTLAEKRNVLLLVLDVVKDAD